MILFTNVTKEYARSGTALSALSPFFERSTWISPSPRVCRNRAP